jgi:hypothetical protein
MKNATMKLVALAVLCTILFVGCTASTVIDIAELGISFAEAALPIVTSALCNSGASGACISSTLESNLLSYLQSAAAALGDVSQILATGGSTTSLGAQIVAALAPIVASEPGLTGLPGAIASAIGAVAKEISNLLGQYPNLALATPGEKAKIVHFHGHDQDRLIVVHARAVALQAQIAALRARR